MKAMQLPHPAPVDDAPLVEVEVEVPEPGPGQVRLKVHTCGVCHTDLHIVEGDLVLPRLPTIPGHQIVGRVDAVGDEVTWHRVGDRLGVPSFCYPASPPPARAWRPGRLRQGRRSARRWRWFGLVQQDEAGGAVGDRDGHGKLAAVEEGFDDDLAGRDVAEGEGLDVVVLQDA